MGFRLSQAADEGVIEIFHSGLIQFGLTQADQYHDALFDVFDLIANNPRMPCVESSPVRAVVCLYGPPGPKGGQNAIPITCVKPKAAITTANPYDATR